MVNQLAYNQFTGIFLWKFDQSPRVYAGDVAGFKTDSGYIIIQYMGHAFQAHTLAWYIMTGEVVMTDHRDRVRHHNKYVNLRPCNYSQNGANRATTNALGLKGVYERRYKTKTMYLAQITHNYVNHYLGSFDTPEEAYDAYRQAAQHFFGEFTNA